jgi:cob(I)alamin adenosyltransferase
MVNLTRIYTRTGDDGSTALGDMTRTSKNDPRLVAYADVDEANSHIGLALALDATTGALPASVVATLTRIQNEMFDVGADLCVPETPDPEIPPLRVEPEYIARLEAECDRFNADLPKLASFVLPGGTPTAAALHIARTVARRAERSTWTALAANPDTMGPRPAQYLNRLSDLLFILARVANTAAGGDVLWRPGGDR